jgi:hypothetical protein
MPFNVVRGKTLFGYERPEDLQDQYDPQRRGELRSEKKREECISVACQCVGQGAGGQAPTPGFNDASHSGM